MRKLTDLETYSPEYEGLFASIHAQAAQGDGPTDEELLCIMKWKLSIITSAHFGIIRQYGDTIRESLLKSGAGVDQQRQKAMESLILVPYVKVALASAFLTACWPSQFTILDWRALEELKEAGFDNPPWPVKSDKWAQDVNGYLKRYIPAVEEFRQANGIGSLREADRILWGRSVRRRIRTGLGLTL